jgi:GlcNAc-P-P-Und epimerase
MGQEAAPDCWDVMRKTTKKKRNCWEVMRCGRGPADRSGGSKDVCPAARDARLDGVHGGINSGRACWVVAGTLCGGVVQGTFARKLDGCQSCEFFQQVLREERSGFQKTAVLLQKLKQPARLVDITTKKFGVLIGGSGLIGGALMHYFKTKTEKEVEILAPNSKRLSLREPEDLKRYLQSYRPDFIINSAISPLDSDAQLAYEVNYLGSINLAKAAMALKIPYIHFSSAAVLPMGVNLTEDDQLPLSAELPFYPRSKLMAEMTLRHLQESRGLDCTIIRLGVVYGKHDHKIQGFHRLLFAIASQAMMFMLTRQGVLHSYTNTKKVPPFVHYVLNHRDEFSGQTLNFVDSSPVELSQLILAIKLYLELNRPRELYVPYSLAKIGQSCLEVLLGRLRRLGLDARMPAELMFLGQFYQSQVLCADKLRQSSYGNRNADLTVYTELPDIINYYTTRWQQFNLMTPGRKGAVPKPQGTTDFLNKPEELLAAIHSGKGDYLADYGSLRDEEIARSSDPAGSRAVNY